MDQYYIIGINSDIISIYTRSKAIKIISIYPKNRKLSKIFSDCMSLIFNHRQYLLKYRKLKY